ncbi:MAG: YqgE/AlgH family protein [Proteobacteria bacterium]|nr:YqgE/AlgH family protein [Pseudomonadota bacterium]
MRLTPRSARMYLLLGVFLVALPSMGGLYKGNTGKFLVVSPKMAVGPFQESVVYIVEHDLFHAYGYIINKPLDEERMAEAFPEGTNGRKAYYGGPVGYPDTSTVIGNGPNGPVINRWEGGEERIVAGYAGWTFLQLNYEMLRGAWDVVDYDPALMFDTDPAAIWGAARVRVLRERPVKDRKGI